MSHKNIDNHKRWRNITVAFRMSQPEREELRRRVKLTGKTTQDYLIRSSLNQQIVVVTNKKVIDEILIRLSVIEEELKKWTDRNDIDDVTLYEIRTILEIVNAMHNS